MATIIARLKNSIYWDEIDKMVREGYSLSYIADWILQKEEFKDLKKRSIESSLYKYRKELSPMEVAKTKMPKVFLEAWQKIEKDINELRELRKLYLLQRDRLNIDYKTEKKIGKLFATTHREVITAVQILKDLVGLKQSLGVIPKDLGKVTIETDVAAQFENLGQKVGIPLERLVTDNKLRQKILGIIKLLEEQKDDTGL